MSDNLPDNYRNYIEDPEILKNEEKKYDPLNYPVGCTTFENFFTHEELLEMEKQVEITENKCSNSNFMIR